MIQKLIKNKINNLTLDDLKILCNNNNINLNTQELNYLYNKLKKDWYSFLYNDPTSILSDIKDNINDNSYNKLLDLYYYYKDRYKNYL